MELIRKNIKIRTATTEDAPLLASWWNDGRIMAHAGFPNGISTTPEEVEKGLGPGSLILLYSEQPIGELHWRIVCDNSCEIGIKICTPEHQNKGIGRIALSLLIQELFRRGLTKIRLDTDLQNKRAQHVYETLGFCRMRINHNSWQDQLGNFRSSVDYELIPGNFINFAV